MPDAVEWMAYNRQGGVPWHGKGTALEGVFTAEEGLVAAGLDFETLIKDAGYSDVFGNFVPVAGDHYTYRSDTGAILGRVGAKYTPLNNKDAFAWADGLVADGGAHYETAGALYEGKKTFMALHFPEHVMVVGNDDLVKTYLVVANSHDGSEKLTAAVTGIRVVCANTLRAALDSAKSMWKVRHTSGLQDRMAEARLALGMTIDYMKAFERVANEMNNVDISSSALRIALEDVDWAPRHIDKVIDLFDNAPNLEGVRGSLWAAWNAGVEQVQWERAPRTEDAFLDTTLYYTKPTDRLFARLQAVGIN